MKNSACIGNNDKNNKESGCGHEEIGLGETKERSHLETWSAREYLKGKDTVWHRSDRNKQGYWGAVEGPWEEKHNGAHLKGWCVWNENICRGKNITSWT